jgi:nicotinic acid phosphoribosyltransferase
MPQHIENAEMLYREGGEIEIEGKQVEYKIFDRDDVESFEAARAAGWKPHAEIFTGEEEVLDIASMTKAQLLEALAELKVEVPASATKKEELVKLLSDALDKEQA